MFEFSFEAMGTKLNIKILDDVSFHLQEKIKLEVFNFTIYFDDNFSRFKQNSLVTKLSETTGTFSVPFELLEMLEIYKKFSSLTDGKMNPLIGHTISDLGYDANYSLRKKEIIRPTPNFSESLEIISDSANPKIKLNQKVLIDIGAIGKGYWVDRVSEILQENKISKYIIDGSGDIYYRSTSSEKLNINLDYQGSIIGNCKIENEAICGSGTDRRNWSLAEGDNLHHILDAKNNLPTDNIDSVWVKLKPVNPNFKLPTTYCDALTTVLFLTSVDKVEEARQAFKNIFTFDYLIIYKNIDNKKIPERIYSSRNFDANIF